MAEDSAAQEAIAAASKEAVEQGANRKVTVEVIHKQEGWSATAWTAIGMLVIVAAVAVWFMSSDAGSAGGGGSIFGDGGLCGDGIDNDGDGRIDRQDGDCYDSVNPEWTGYDSSHREDGRHDPPGDE